MGVGGLANRPPRRPSSARLARLARLIGPFGRHSINPISPTTSHHATTHPPCQEQSREIAAFFRRFDGENTGRRFLNASALPTLINNICARRAHRFRGFFSWRRRPTARAGPSPDWSALSFGVHVSPRRSPSPPREVRALPRRVRVLACSVRAPARHVRVPACRVRVPARRLRLLPRRVRAQARASPLSKAENEVSRQQTPCCPTCQAQPTSPRRSPDPRWSERD